MSTVENRDNSHLQETPASPGTSPPSSPPSKKQKLEKFEGTENKIQNLQNTPVNNSPGVGRSRSNAVKAVKFDVTAQKLTGGHGEEDHITHDKQMSPLTQRAIKSEAPFKNPGNQTFTCAPYYKAHIKKAQDTMRTMDKMMNKKEKPSPEREELNVAFNEALTTLNIDFTSDKFIQQDLAKVLSAIEKMEKASPNNPINGLLGSLKQQLIASDNSIKELVRNNDPANLVQVLMEDKRAWDVIPFLLDPKNSSSLDKTDMQKLANAWNTIQTNSDVKNPSLPSSRMQTAIGSPLKQPTTSPTVTTASPKPSAEPTAKNKEALVKLMNPDPKTLKLPDPKALQIALVKPENKGLLEAIPFMLTTPNALTPEQKKLLHEAMDKMDAPYGKQLVITARAQGIETKFVEGRFSYLLDTLKQNAAGKDNKELERLEGSFMRGNTVDTAILSDHLQEKMKNHPQLKGVLSQAVKTIESELKKSESKNAKVVDENGIKKIQISEAFIRQILLQEIAKTGQQMPSEVRQVLQQLSSGISGIFTGLGADKAATLGEKQLVSNLFLRAITPLVLRPEKEGTPDSQEGTPDSQETVKVKTAVMQQMQLFGNQTSKGFTSPQDESLRKDIFKAFTAK